MVAVIFTEKTNIHELYKLKFLLSNLKTKTTKYIGSLLYEGKDEYEEREQLLNRKGKTELTEKANY